MEKLLLISVIGLAIIGFSSGATQYTVGDNSGWDISTDLDTWPSGKTFNVGDVLVFQYSSSHSVCQVTRENFDTCNTTNALQTYNSGGNNTVALNEAGDKFFICGNKLHCLGGMKLKVTVENNQATAPTTAAGAPQATTGGPNSFPNPSSKTNNQIPTSSTAPTFGNLNNNANIVLVFVGSFVISMLFN